MKNLMLAGLCFAIVLLTSNGLMGQSLKTREIASLMNKAVQLGIFNGNVLVVEKGKIVYDKAVGYSDARKTIRLTPGYRFSIGSIGKEFNAVGIMMLKERGKLSLDDKVSKFLTDLPSWANSIRISDLLRYTSGLPDINWETAKRDEDTTSDLKNLKNLDFEPGSKYAYNNTNVFLQRRIIEKITGRSYKEFLSDEMLKPCGMTKTVIDPDLRGKNLAVSFNNDLVPDPRQFYYVLTGWPSVTTMDLYKWTQCLNSFRLINSSSYREILTPFSPGRQASLGTGYMDGDVVKEHWHDGQSLDFEALMYDQPSEGVTIILLSNNKNFKLQELKSAIKSILNGEPYKMPKRSILLAVTRKMGNFGAEEIIKLYDDIAGPRGNEIDREADFNQIGYSLMGDKRIDEAIKIFEWNVKMFPMSANAYDSLGEAYLNKGDKRSALINYKKSFELDPTNLGAKQVIESLEK